MGRLLPLVYLIYAVPLCLFLALATPPFQVADEPAHVLRAAQLAGGAVIGERREATAGGPLDPALPALAALFADIPFHSERTVSAAVLEQARALSWTGHDVFIGFPSSTAYAPAFYGPMALALAIGKAVGWTPYVCLLLGRILGAAAALALCAAAIWQCRRGRLFLFSVLALPMPLSLFASGNPDGLTIAATALALALVSRGLSGADAPRRGDLWLSVLCLALVGMAKPPNAALAGLLLALPAPRRQKAGAVLLVLAATLGWLVATRDLRLPLAHGDIAPDPAGQVAYLIHNIAALPGLLWATVKLHAVGLGLGFIGSLGWLDTLLPKGYYAGAAVCLGLALLHDTRERLGMVPALLAAGAILAVSGGMALSLYIIWSPVGAPVVEGLQGRYFLPAALASVFVLPALPLPERGRRWASRLCLVFPLATLAVVPPAILQRYY